MVYQAIYSSAATDRVNDRELADILSVARTRNAAAGITGALLFMEGSFLQVLEGSKDDVVALLEKIIADPRHRDVTVFHQSEVSEPVFTQWRMAYLSPDGKDVAHWSGADGTATLADLRADIERRPGRVPEILLSIVDAVAA